MKLRLYKGIGGQSSITSCYPVIQASQSLKGSSSAEMAIATRSKEMRGAEIMTTGLEVI